MRLPLAAAVIAIAAFACTSDDRSERSAPAPPVTATATPAPPIETSQSPEPDATQEPTFAPDGRTPDEALNALIDSLLHDDAATLE